LENKSDELLFYNFFLAGSLGPFLVLSVFQATFHFLVLFLLFFPVFGKAQINV
jgi:hypothetical protein